MEVLDTIFDAYRFLLQTMGCLTTLLLVVVGGAATTLGSQWCSREDADVTIALWTQAFGIGGNGDVNNSIRGGTGFFAKYVGTDIERHIHPPDYSINTQIIKSINKLISLSVSQSTNQPTNQQISESASQSVRQSVSQSVTQSVSQSINQLVDPSIHPSFLSH